MNVGPHGQTDGIEEYEAAPPLPKEWPWVTYPCPKDCATCEEIRGWADVQ